MQTNSTLYSDTSSTSTSTSVSTPISDTQNPVSKKLSPLLSEQVIQETLMILAEHHHWQSHVNQSAYSQGWDVLALRCKKDHIDAHPILQCFAVEESNQASVQDEGNSEWQDLPLLSRLHGIQTFLSDLQCPIKSVRLMRLQPGGEILPHRDKGLSLKYGQARLHVPIASSEQVAFFVDGEQLPMVAGELWYMNADKEHWVKNNSNSDRIHLIIDCEVNDWLDQLITENKPRVADFNAIVSPHEQVRALLQQFHKFEELEPGLIKQASDLLFQRIAELADFTDYSHGLNKENHTDTAHGKACSSDVAAMCTIEFMRNYRFQLGILKAIQDKSQESTPVQLLYAGSGPFGSLVIPLLLLLKPDQVHVTIIDIHRESLDRLKRLVKALALEDFISAYHLADATEWKPDNDKTYDIIVSETMKAMLEQEPQVAVFTNLEAFLKPTGIFIPEKIRIKAWLVDSATEYNQTLASHNFTSNVSAIVPSVCIADMFSLDRNAVVDIRKNGIEKASKGCFTLPNNVEQFNLIQYSTDIQVYDSVVLNKKECSLTCPKVVPLDQNLAGKDMYYHYQMGRYPEFIIRPAD